jgi:hypothetical protein
MIRIAFSVFLLVSGAAFAAGWHNTRAYTTKRGTYVPAHKQTNPNKTKTDNWSHKGNVNPFTGKRGTKQ